MEFKIDTDLIPIKPGIPHFRENWKSPEADKMNNAYEFLKQLNHKGFLKLEFDSKSQEFSILFEECKDLTNDEINGITEKLLSHIKRTE